MKKDLIKKEKTVQIDLKINIEKEKEIRQIFEMSIEDCITILLYTKELLNEKYRFINKNLKELLEKDGKIIKENKDNLEEKNDCFDCKFYCKECKNCNYDE